MIVDCFGGSGLVSNFFKQMYPNARVIYNDYDYYTKRLDKIEQTNEILKVLRGIIEKHNIKREVKLSVGCKQEIISFFDSLNNFDEVTIYGNLSYRGTINTKDKFNYNKVSMSDYALDDRYLKGVEIVHCDYIELIENYKNDSDVLFIFDPPYIQTENNHYDGWFTIKDFLKLYYRIIKLNNFIFFSSERSGATDIIDYYGVDDFCDEVIKFNSSMTKHELLYVRKR